jgi:hypothetical protein
MLYNPDWKPSVEEIKPLDWRQILLDAANLIEKYGWATKTYSTTSGKMCALGAIGVAAAGGHEKAFLTDDNRYFFLRAGVFHSVASDLNASTPEIRKAIMAVRKAAGTRTWYGRNKPIPSITVWNDRGNSAEHVAATLRKAATLKDV